MTCSVDVRRAATVIDAMPIVDDARLAQSDIGPTVEVTLSNQTLLPNALTDTARALGLHVDLRRSATRGDDSTVVLRR